MVEELLHELLNDLRVRILGNQEILEKSQIGDMSGDIIFLPKIKFYSSNQKITKSRYQSFLICIILMDFVTLFQT